MKRETQSEVVKMREILFKFDRSGHYLTDDNTSFNGESKLKCIVEPHDFSLEIGGEVIRESSFEGGYFIASNNGETLFYNNNDELIARANGCDGKFKRVEFVWKQNVLCVQYGHVETIDFYPNCDGESDRYADRWETEYMVTYFAEDGSVEII